MRSFSFLFLSLGLGLFSHPAFPSLSDACCGRCTGSAYCSACKNCSRCAYCNSGGSCGVCSSGGSPNYSTPKRSGSRSSGSSRSGSSIAPSRISPSTTPAPRVRTITLPAMATVQAAKLNVREGPGTQYRILGRLEAGETVTVVETAGEDWVVIEYLQLINGDFETRRGYVFKKFLSFL